MTSNAIANIKKDLLGQPLQILSGLDILGNASSALGHMSKGVAALSMDKKFIQNRQRQVCYELEIFIYHVEHMTIYCMACYKAEDLNFDKGKINKEWLFTN